MKATIAILAVFTLALCNQLSDLTLRLEAQEQMAGRLEVSCEHAGAALQRIQGWKP